MNITFVSFIRQLISIITHMFVFIKNIFFYFFKHFELIFWITGLIYLIIIIPEQNHLTFCPLNNLGIKFCPGCGLGRSISMIFHFNIEESFKNHPLGLPALIIIISRIVQLITKIRREQND